MYYHTVVLHLFRPFLKLNFKDSNISPREICMECADSAAGLVAAYRRLYGLRRVPILLTHVLLTSSITHLLHLPNTSAALHLAQSITSLRETTLNHRFSIRLFRIIVALAKQWNIQLPAVVEEALVDTSAEDSMALPPENPQYGFHTTDLSQNATYLQSAVSGHLPMCSLASPVSYAPAGNFYWSPFIDGSVPLQSHIAVSQMDNSAVLHQPVDQWQHLDQYGFQVAAHDRQIPQGVSASGHWP